MKHIPADKYNIAWFKLAEFVTRKEKERALGIYRLLSHSLPNAALKAQLEGDILLAFQDTRALECYNKAAQLYQDANQHSQAAALLEHVAYISTDYIYYCPILVELYAGLYNQPKIVQYVTTYIKELLKGGQNNAADDYLEEINNRLDSTHTIALYESLALIYCDYIPVLEHKTRYFIEHVLVHTPSNSYQLHRFLSLLQQTNADYYQYALTYLTL